MNANDHLPIELLSAHLDGETTADERARVQAHLAGCESCRATFEDLRRIVEATARLGVPELPEALRRRIATAVVRPAPRRRAWIGAAASIAAVGLVATTWYLQGPERTVPAPQLGAVQAPAENEAAGFADVPVPAPPPPPPPAPASPRSRAKVKAEAKLDAAKVRETLSSDEKRQADSGFARDRDEVARPERAEATEPMAEVSASAAAPSAQFGIDDGPVAFVELAPENAIDRAALLDALKEVGVALTSGTDERTIEGFLPRLRWPQCRAVLERFGIPVDEAKVRALPGDSIGIRVRTSPR